MDAATLIKQVRTIRGWTQSDLAARLNVAPSAIARWESGRTSPRVEALARVFEVAELRPVIELLDDSSVDRDQLRERLAWTPAQRLAYLADMLAFEERAHRAKRVE